MKIIEQNVETILRPTGINLAPFVINPYQGCQLGCCFCYAQFGKTAKKQNHAWGTYVKVKINAIEVLKKELELIKPKSVLLGSITECFQPVEKKYGITRQILELLNEQAIQFTIMSRSTLITDYLDVLGKGNCQSIYFTINALPDVLNSEFNMQAPDFKPGLETVLKLQNKKLKVISYFCPILPMISDIKQIVNSAKEIVKQAEFEIINFNMAKQSLMVKAIEKHYPEYKPKYEKLLKDKVFLMKL
ncbi:MAG: radical SAM protein [Candidatus Omnitrophota bacterium]